MTRKPTFRFTIFVFGVFLAVLISSVNSFPYNSNGTEKFIENQNIPVEGTARMQIYSGSPSWFSIITARKKDMFMDFLKFFLTRILTKKWTTKLAIKRLDKVKASLIKYYAKQTLFQTTETTLARNKPFGFPSLEGALLSLAFLTFSVFLIDLVQTLLAKLKLTTTVTAAPALSSYLGGRSRTGSSLKHSSKRGLYESDISFDDERMTTLSSKVLSAIERPFQKF